MARFPVTIFLSAFLLFEVQPLMGKYILPWFGGGPAVWTACMLFFQVLLLVGYLYAHWTSTWFSRRTQGLLHLGLLAVSLLLLPIAPKPAWKPAGAGDPTGHILLLLLVVVGMPYFLLSTTGPLLQRWFHDTFPGRSPYRLYALSNAGSLLALLSYPAGVEPFLTLGRQARVWSWAYAAFAVSCGWCAGRLAWAAPGSTPVAEPAPDEGAPQPAFSALLLWMALSACGSVLLLATTSQMCQEVAVVPFLWILPLAIYLLSFMICFDHERWYDRRVFALLLAVAVPIACKILVKGLDAPLWQHVSAYTGVLLAGCMCCFGELARAKPDPRHLTLYYLLIAAGGALGGVFVAVAAPRLFVEYREFHFGLAACALLTLVGWWRGRAWKDYAGRPWWVALPSVGLLMAALVGLVAAAYGRGYSSLQTRRNFYGILRVSEHADNISSYLSLSHGGTLHGFQYTEDDKRTWPTSYYGPDSAVGLAVQHHPRRSSVMAGQHGSLRIGVVGLGTGTIAAWGRPGDTIRFYEINSAVQQIAEHTFTYLKDSKARVNVVLGDGRVRLEQEAARNELQGFDVLAIDAFSSDAIPSHLLTLECAGLYRRHLKPDGLLLLHISNRALDLAPIARALAQRLGWQAVRIDSEKDDMRGVYAATWIILTNNRAFLDSNAVIMGMDTWKPEDRPPLLWTDDFVSLWKVLKF